jgi:hypothetical protein
MDEVVGHIAAVERARQTGLVGDVEEDRLAPAPVRLRPPGGGPHLVAGREEGGDQGAAHEAGGAGHERLRTLTR